MRATQTIHGSIWELVTALLQQMSGTDLHLSQLSWCSLITNYTDLPTLWLSSFRKHPAPFGHHVILLLHFIPLFSLSVPQNHELFLNNIRLCFGMDCSSWQQPFQLCTNPIDSRTYWILFNYHILIKSLSKLNCQHNLSSSSNPWIFKNAHNNPHLLHYKLFP